MSNKALSEFEEKRIAYFKRAAQNFDWVRLGPGDVNIFEHAEADHYNFKAADSWEDAAMMQMDSRLDVEGELDDAKEEIAHHLRRIERFKKQIQFLKNELREAYEEIGEDPEEIEEVCGEDEDVQYNS